MAQLAQEDIKALFCTVTTNCNVKYNLFYNLFVYVVHCCRNELPQKFLKVMQTSVATFEHHVCSNAPCSL